MTAEFTPRERRELLAFVRKVIAGEFSNAEQPAAPAIPQLAVERACFVTLHDCSAAASATSRRSSRSGKISGAMR